MGKKMSEDEIRKLKKVFHRMKASTFEEWNGIMNRTYTNAYELCMSHFDQAADSVLPPRYKKALMDKQREVRELWDGIEEVTIEDVDFDAILPSSTEKLRRRLMQFERMDRELVEALKSQPDNPFISGIRSLYEEVKDRVGLTKPIE